MAYIDLVSIKGTRIKVPMMRLFLVIKCRFWTYAEFQCGYHSVRIYISPNITEYEILIIMTLCENLINIVFRHKLCLFYE